jgi:nicotinamidase-related amidase
MHHARPSARWTALAAAALVALIPLIPSGARAQTVIDDWSKVQAPPAPALSAVTVNPKKTALFVMDFNVLGCVPDKRARCAAALPRLHKLLVDARAAGVTIVHSLSVGTVADISKELTPLPGEHIVLQGTNGPVDKFYEDGLAKSLRDKGIDTVIVTGTSANGAVLFTASGAALRGFKVIVPVDGMPADGLYQEQFVAWELANAPVVKANVTLTKMDMISL